MDPDALAAADRGRPRGGLRPFLVVAAPAPRTPAPSTRSPRSPTSPRARACGCTSTPRTAVSSSSPSAAAQRCRHRARRLDHARPAQGPVPAVRDRRLARAGRPRRCARRTTSRRRLPPGPAPDRATCRILRATRPSSRATSAACACGCRCKLHGVAAFREALDEKLDLAAHLYGGTAGRSPGIEVPWEPQLRGRVPPARGTDEDRHAAFLERINAGRARIPVEHDDRRPDFLRVCIVSHRTHRDRIDECIEAIRSAAREG